MKKMRKTLSLILALVLAFSLAAVPAFAADATEAETSTSDTAYGQLHNGLLSEILSRIDIANDDNFIHGIVNVNINDLVDHIVSNSNFIHGIVNVDVGDLFKDIASNNNYMHGIITITGNTVNINFGQVIGDIAARRREQRGRPAGACRDPESLWYDADRHQCHPDGLCRQHPHKRSDRAVAVSAHFFGEYEPEEHCDDHLCALQQPHHHAPAGDGAAGKVHFPDGQQQRQRHRTEPTQSAGLLDTTNHNAYVSGRTATTFVPNGTLTRAEAAKLLYELMTAQAHKQYDRSDNGFSDVPAGKWYVVAVSTLANAGAIKGYSNGTFQPGKPITRAEFVTILTGIYGVNTSKGMPFADVGSAWCHDAVATAYANGWVGGYADGTFHPNQTITRAEAVTILNRVLGRSCDLTFVQANAQAASHFTDVTPGACGTTPQSPRPRSATPLRS